MSLGVHWGIPLVPQIQATAGAALQDGYLGFAARPCLGGLAGTRPRTSGDGSQAISLRAGWRVLSPDSFVLVAEPAQATGPGSLTLLAVDTDRGRRRWEQMLPIEDDWPGRTRTARMMDARAIRILETSILVGVAGTAKPSRAVRHATLAVQAVPR